MSDALRARADALNVPAATIVQAAVAALLDQSDDAVKAAAVAARVSRITATTGAD